MNNRYNNLNGRVVLQGRGCSHHVNIPVYVPPRSVSPIRHNPIRHNPIRHTPIVQQQRKQINLKRYGSDDTVIIPSFNNAGSANSRSANIHFANSGSANATSINSGSANAASANIHSANVPFTYQNTQSIIQQSINAHSVTKKNIFYGVKKTILSDLNYLNNSSNSNDFKIGINNNNIFDCFYLFPNISEINTKNETNIVNEKKVELFTNINDENDKQYFPIDFVACGITLPFSNKIKKMTKIRITNIFWNIFQSTKNKTDKLLAVVPERDKFMYHDIKLNINFELHSQVSSDILEKLPYKNNTLNKNISPSNSCLYKVLSFDIGTLNGSNFDTFEINILPNYDIQCALLCVKISVPDECNDILIGADKYNKLFYGYIPFSQFILNFDYEVL